MTIARRRQLEQLVAQAAIDYVDYFFPKEETGMELAWTAGGELIRAVRELQQLDHDDHVVQRRRLSKAIGAKER